MGFGERSGNYWLGNDLLSQLTANNRYKLRFDLQQRDTGNWYYHGPRDWRAVVLRRVQHVQSTVRGRQLHAAGGRVLG